MQLQSDLTPLGFLRNVHDFVLEDEQIGRALAGEAHHILVVILDPSLDNLAVHQLNADALLLLSQGLQISGFFKSVVGRRSLPSLTDGIRGT